VLVPVDWPLAEILKRHSGWQIIKDDGQGVLFERRTPVLINKSEISAESTLSITSDSHP